MSVRLRQSDVRGGDGRDLQYTHRWWRQRGRRLEERPEQRRMYYEEYHVFCLSEIFL